jgi:hypothetical protein
MKLDDLREAFDRYSFPAAHLREHPDRDSVMAARSAVTSAVRDEEFLVDCMYYELAQLERGEAVLGLIPFITLPTVGIRLAFGYWPPHGNAGAHEHTAWTITGVCHNELAIQTYDRDESYLRQVLVPKNHFHAPAGQVGFIYEPCIHDPRNDTDSWSLSLHVSSPWDGQTLADQERCLPILDDIRRRRFEDGCGQAYDKVVAGRYRQLKIRAIAEFLSQVDDVPVTDLLQRCVRDATTATRRFIYGLGRTDLVELRPHSRRSIARTDPDLVLTYREVGDDVLLGVETRSGWVEELAIASVAREAIAFCVDTPRFDVVEIPGNLTDEERWSIAEALEETGLFTIDAGE